MMVSPIPGAVGGEMIGTGPLSRQVEAKEDAAFGGSSIEVHLLDTSVVNDMGGEVRIDSCSH